MSALPACLPPSLRWTRPSRDPDAKRKGIAPLSRPATSSGPRGPHGQATRGGGGPAEPAAGQRGDRGEGQASARFRAAAQPAGDGDEAGRGRWFPRETLRRRWRPNSGTEAPQWAALGPARSPRRDARREQEPRSLTVAGRSRSAPFPGLSSGLVGPLHCRPSRVSAAGPSPSAPSPHSARPARQPPPHRAPPASPSTAAEAAVGPIVVGIEVRHLPSPLLEEPAGQRGRTPQYNSSSPRPPRSRGCPPRCLIANRTHACARRRRARPWADGAGCWPRRALRPTWCGGRPPTPERRAHALPAEAHCVLA